MNISKFGKIKIILKKDKKDYYNILRKKMMKMIKKIEKQKALF